MIVYKLITAESGIKELEDKITTLINDGWKLAGGISFNHGYPYQAVIGKETPIEKPPGPAEDKAPKELGANEAMKKLDDLI